METKLWQKWNKHGVFIPLVGYLQLTQPRSRLVDSPNQHPDSLAAWTKTYKDAGAKTPRHRRRLDVQLSLAFKQAKVRDRDVVELARSFIVSCPKSSVVERLITLFDSVLDKCPGDLEAGSPAWDLLREALAIKVDPNSYSDPESYFWDASCVKLLSKYPFTGAAEVAQDTAINKLLMQESSNRQTNARWKEGNFDPHEYDLIGRVTSELGKILGSPPSADEVLEAACWGPGTLVGYAFDGDLTGAEFKFAGPLSCTPQLQPLLEQVIKQYPAWYRHWRVHSSPQGSYQVSTGDELFTVRKKFEEDRCAMKQASLNAWLQRGLGKIISRRLLKSGVDLQHQQFHNRKLARIGSINGGISTIDLTSASDSMCRAVMKSVLCSGWLNWVRILVASHFILPFSYTSRHTSVKRIQAYQMVSAMGCGFTFELETSLFLAIVRACVPGVWTNSGPLYTCGDGKWRRKTSLSWPHCGVNGDDIIVPTAYAGKVIAALRLFGFTPNESKSFIDPDGRFRESCGADFFQGVGVRPFFLSKELCDGPQVLQSANAILDKASEIRENLGCHYDGGLDSRYAKLWRDLIGHIPSSVRRVSLSPPGTPGGLWAPWLCDNERPSGNRPAWRILSLQPDKIELENTFATSRFSNESESESWSCSLDGDNLLAARLSVLGSDPAERHAYVEPLPLGEGMNAVRRGTQRSRVAVTFAVPVLGRRWSGWTS